MPKMARRGGVSAAWNKILSKFMFSFPGPKNCDLRTCVKQRQHLSAVSAISHNFLFPA